MPTVGHFKLRFGPYRTPRFRHGQIVRCLMRAKVKIVGATDSPNADRPQRVGPSAGRNSPAQAARPRLGWGGPRAEPSHRLSSEVRVLFADSAPKNGPSHEPR